MQQLQQNNANERFSVGFLWLPLNEYLSILTKASLNKECTDEVD